MAKNVQKTPRFGLLDDFIEVNRANSILVELNGFKNLSASFVGAVLEGQLVCDVICHYRPPSASSHALA